MAVPSGPTFDPLTTCVSVSKLSWQDLPRWEVLQEVEPQVLADYLLETRTKSAWGSLGPEHFMNSEKLPTQIVNSVEAQSNSISAILFDPGML